MRRRNWTRLSNPRDKCATHWEHASGWTLRHCGHPTANWPYYAISPEHPDDVVVTHNGLGFKTLAEGMRSIELVLAGRARFTDERCVAGVRRIVLREQEHL